MAVNLTASGASFPSDIHLELVDLFKREYSQDVSAFNYIPFNSDRGQSDPYNNITQWGGSDVAINRTKYPGPPNLLAFPAVAGAIAISANIPELSGIATPSTPMRLSRSALPLIARNVIQFWNDTRILDCQDNTTVRSILASINHAIIPIIRSPGSGTTINYVRALTSMDPEFPNLSSLAVVAGPLAITAVSNPAVGNIHSSIPYTMTYMDARELAIANENTPTKPLVSISIENKNGEYILPSTSGIRIALSGVDTSNIDPQNSNVIAVDSSLSGAYPISLITNYVIRQDDISDDLDVTVWTLRFLWWTLTNPKLVALVESKSFVHLKNTSASHLSLNVLKSHRFKGNMTIFGQSICDLNPGDPSPCKNGGYCPNTLPFQPAGVACICRNGYINKDRADCSERAPIFMPDILTRIQLGMAAAAGIVVIAIWGLLLLYSRHHKIRSIAPSCCSLILLGCLLGAFSVVAYAATPSDIMCRFRAFFPTLAFGLVFGMIMLKTYRIYLIFGYRHISAARSIRNWTLICLTLLIAVIEVGICTGYVFIAQPVLSQVYISASSSDGSGNTSTSLSHSSSYLTCKPSNKNTYVVQIMEAVLFAFNGGIMFICLVLAFKTRGAYKRYVESKAIGLTTYVVAISVLVALPVIYVVPIESIRTNLVINGVRSILLVVLSTAVPLILYAPRILEALENKRDLEEDIDVRPANIRSGHGGPWHAPGSIPASPAFQPIDASDVLGGVLDAGNRKRRAPENRNLQTFTFEIGFRKNRFGSVWQSAVLMVFPELDLIFFLDSFKCGNTLQSFRLSTSEIEGFVKSGGFKNVARRKSKMGKDGNGDIDISLGKWHGDNENVSSSSSTSGIHQYPPGYMEGVEENGNQAAGVSNGGNPITILPRGDHHGYFIEFSDDNRLRAFYDIHEVVRSRASGVSTVAGRIVSRSQRLNNTPIINVVKNSNTADPSHDSSTSLTGSPATLVPSTPPGETFEGGNDRFGGPRHASSNTILTIGSGTRLNPLDPVPASPNMPLSPKLEASTIASVLSISMPPPAAYSHGPSSPRWENPSTLISPLARAVAGGFIAPPPSLPPWARKLEISLPQPATFGASEESHRAIPEPLRNYNDNDLEDSWLPPPVVASSVLQPAPRTTPPTLHRSRSASNIASQTHQTDCFRGGRRPSAGAVEERGVGRGRYSGRVRFPSSGVALSSRSTNPE
ncbi:hypothetical protein HDU67_007746 [Dinochytrium kinnereticum]|nr:hypothetical protein HDU67_007746 [Dinochytrium kinnereticum]